MGDEGMDEGRILTDAVVVRGVRALQGGVWGGSDEAIVREILRVVGYWQLVADARTALAAAHVAADTLGDALRAAGLPTAETRQSEVLREMGSGAAERTRLRRRETAGVFVSLAETQEENRKLRLEDAKLRGDAGALNEELRGITEELRRCLPSVGLMLPLRSSVRSLVDEVLRFRQEAQSSKGTK
jgi:hypothetical protein